MQPTPSSTPLTVTHDKVKHIVRHRTPDGIHFPLNWLVTTYCNTRITGVTDATLRSSSGGTPCTACQAHHQFNIQQSRTPTHAAQ